MTKEEKKQTILELERSVCRFPSTPEALGLQEDTLPIPKLDGLCEVCGNKLINDECESHPAYMRTHERVLIQKREEYK